MTVTVPPDAKLIVWAELLRFSRGIFKEKLKKWLTHTGTYNIIFQCDEVWSTMCSDVASMARTSVQEAEEYREETILTEVIR